MSISYEVVDNFPGWNLAEDYFKSLLLEHGCNRILEIGSGANPTLSPEFVRQNQLSYVTSDANEEELKKADDTFEQLVLDLTANDIDPNLAGTFDCVLSRMVGEHIQDGGQYHKNIYKLLRPAGISTHCFSTLWALPFTVNRLLPDRLTEPLLNAFGPRDRHRNAKFKAYYSWSRGPTPSAIQHFEALGFEVLNYTGYFGHRYYQRSQPWLHILEQRKSRWLMAHPIPQLCSYATIVLRKPAQAAK